MNGFRKVLNLNRPDLGEFEEIKTTVKKRNQRSTPAKSENIVEGK
jgi:hypothetical protein